MLEYPELFTLSRQMRETLPGKTISDGQYVNPNANIFMESDAPSRYAALVGGSVAAIDFHAPEIYIALNNGYGIVFGQCGGKILYHKAGSDSLPKHNFIFRFSDGSCLTHSVQLWSLGVYAISREGWEERKAQSDLLCFDPMGKTYREYMDFVLGYQGDEKIAVKLFLSKHIAGVMSSLAAEILLYARIHPSVQLRKLNDSAHERLFTSMTEIVSRACALGGRVSEVDLFGKPGGYIAAAERKNIGKPCPVCGAALEKVSVGGVTAYCPNCQAK